MSPKRSDARSTSRHEARGVGAIDALGKLSGALVMPQC